MSDKKSLHACAVRLPAGGVLLLGDSGSGKSSLTLTLCAAHHGTLVADDRVILASRDARLFAAPAEKLRGLLEVRGLGVVRQDFAPATAIDLAVELVAQEKVPRLAGEDFFVFENMRVPLLRLCATDATTPQAIILALQTVARQGFVADGIYETRI